MGMLCNKTLSIKEKEKCFSGKLNLNVKDCERFCENIFISLYNTRNFAETISYDQKVFDIFSQHSSKMHFLSILDMNSIQTEIYRLNIKV